MGRAHATWPGRAPGRAGGRSARAKTRKWGCWSGSTSGATLSGRSIRGPAMPRATSRRRTLRKEVETCGLCHARRGGFSEDWVPGRSLSDTHVVSALARGLYHADGQMRDEVYNYGSFKQSRMFAAGVTCSDCHEPHGAKLRAPGGRRLPAMSLLRQVRSRNAPSPRGGKSAALLRVLPYARPHLHGRRSAARSRLPHPAARSIGKGSVRPMPATIATSDKSAEWAASAIERWHGSNRKGFQNYAEAFNAAWTDRAGCGRASCRRRRQRQRAGVCARERADGVEFARLALRSHQSGARCPFRS